MSKKASRHTVAHETWTLRAKTTYNAGLFRELDRTYSSSEAAKLCGIPIRTVLHWVSKGLFGDGYVGVGSGNARQYSRGDVQVLHIAGQFAQLKIASGVALTYARSAQDLIAKAEVNGQKDYFVFADYHGRNLRVHIAEKNLKGGSFHAD